MMDPPSTTILPADEDVYADSFYDTAVERHSPVPATELSNIEGSNHSSYYDEPPGEHLDERLGEDNGEYPMSDEDRMRLLLSGDTSSLGPADHSLPTAEEARLNALISGTMRSNPYSGRKKRLLLFSICIGALVAIITFSIAIAHKNSVRGSSTSAVSSGGSDGSTDSSGWYGSASKAPADNAGGSGQSVPVPIQRLQQFMDFLVKNGISSRKDLDNHDSPQFRAAEWMMEKDLTKWEIPATTDLRFEQRYILAVFFHALHGFDWHIALKFLTDDSVCNWGVGMTVTSTNQKYNLGVTCNDKDEVNELFITGNNVTGTLPSELGRLTSLEHLSFFNNSISGSFPSEMQNLTALKFLAMERNKLSGPLPSWLNKLTALEYLALGENSLSGELPSFQGLTKLKELSLDQNHLTGSIDALNSATSLANVFLNDNSFNGRIHSTTFQNFDYLEVVDLSDNYFIGYFPEHFYSFKILDLHKNYLSGNLPEIKFRSFPLQFLNLHKNNFTGDIPVSLGFLSHLYLLDLCHNNFNGAVYDSINTLTNLRHLLLDHNPLTPGHIPYIRNLTSLEEFGMKATNRNRRIPTWMGELKTLTVLDLHNNQLTGSIPSELGYLTNLNVLQLNHNLLTGKVPTTFANLDELALLSMDKNNLTGDASAICVAGTKAGYTADCDEVTCPCCGVCCNDLDQKCNQGELFLSANSVYARNQTLFSENLFFGITIQTKNSTK